MTYRTRKSTLSFTTVFLLPVIRFAKLNKRPPSPPKKKLVEKYKAPGGLNRVFMVSFERMRNVNTTLKNDDDFFQLNEKTPKERQLDQLVSQHDTEKVKLLLNREKDDA